MVNDDCEWTVATLKVFLTAMLTAQDTKNTARFESVEKQTALSLKAAEQAVLKAESAAEKRFESVNEFRNTLADQQRNLMPRSEVAVMFAAISNQMIALEKQVDAMKSEALGIRGGWGYAVGLIGVVMTLVSLGILMFKALQ